MSSELRTRVVYAGALGASVYGSLKLAWTLGTNLGINGVPPWKSHTGWWRQAGAVTEFVAFEGTVILAAVAVLILLAAVRPWGRRLPARALEVLTASALAVAGFAWVGGSAGIVARALHGRSLAPQGTGELVPWTFWLLWAVFGLMALGFGGAVAVGRRRAFERRGPGTPSMNTAEPEPLSGAVS